MAKPEWGTKRTCQSCGARFYDLKHTPIVCPKCGHKHDIEDFIKTRRSRSTAAKQAPAPAPKKVPAKVVPDILEEAGTAVPDEAAGEDLIEDTEDLGEDSDEIPEVIEGEEEPST